MINVAAQCEPIQKPPLLSGFLLEPLGWMRDRLAAAVESEPDLLRDICSLDCKRMHLIAVALAHLDGPYGPQTVRFLLRRRTVEVFDHIFGRRPRGLKRAIGKLSFEVMKPEGYHLLVDLLDDPDGFKFLAHADYIGEESLEELANTPAPVRPLLVPFIGLDGTWTVCKIVDGLRLLVARGAAPSFEALFNEFKPSKQPLQLCAYVRKLVDALSLPTELPPLQIGPARRLDNTAEIRELAKRWRNCLEDVYLSKIDAGTCAVYLWDDPEAPAVCSVMRFGRLGWFLNDVKGPRNARLPGQHLSRILKVFANAGIPQDNLAHSIQTFIGLD